MCDVLDKGLPHSVDLSGSGQAVDRQTRRKDRVVLPAGLQSAIENGAVASAPSLSSDTTQSWLRTALGGTDLASNFAKVGETFLKGEGVVGRTAITLLSKPIQRPARLSVLFDLGVPVGFAPAIQVFLEFP